MNSTDVIIASLATIIVLVCLFLLLRSFTLWYFKITKREENQREMIDLLTELVRLQTEEKKVIASAPLTKGSLGI